MRFALVARAVLSMLVAVIATSAIAAGKQDAEGTGAGQVALYQAEQAVLVGEGSAVVDLFLAADNEAFLERSSDEVRAALSDASFDRLLEFLQTDRLHMELPATGGQFGGHFNGIDSISGFYKTDQQSGSFRLTAEEPANGDVPTGRWTGTILPDEIEFSVEFSGPADALTATIDVPSMDIAAAPLENVSFSPEQPLGDVVARQALPISPSLRIYAEVREWGSTRLVISMVLDASGTIRSFRLTPLLLTSPENDADPPGTQGTYRLPSDETLFVYWGGHGELPSHHAGSPGQSEGYEFMIWRDGSIHKGDGTRNEDYHVWGLPVLSPASGTVVAVKNSVPDHAPGDVPADEELLDAVDQAGNYVVIQVAPDEWVVLAHLQQGSVQVNVGDEVRAGDQIALVGNSGTANEPMLHMHAQSTADLNAAEDSAITLFVGDFVADGDSTIPLGVPTRGHFVSPAASPSD